MAQLPNTFRRKQFSIFSEMESLSWLPTSTCIIRTHALCMCSLRLVYAIQLNLRWLNPFRLTSLSWITKTKEHLFGFSAQTHKQHTPHVEQLISDWIFDKIQAKTRAMGIFAEDTLNVLHYLSDTQQCEAANHHQFLFFFKNQIPFGQESKNSSRNSPNHIVQLQSGHPLAIRGCFCVSASLCLNI